MAANLVLEPTDICARTRLMVAKPNSIITFLALLHCPSDVFEVRAFDACDPRKPQGRFSADWHGYFNDLDLAAKACEHLSERCQAGAVYATLNPTVPEMLAIAPNKLVRLKSGKGTKDRDVIGRRRLLIDFDAEKPHKAIMATDAEMTAAVKCRDEVMMYLASMHWPRPIVTSSGNGGGLIYVVDLPNDSESLELIDQVLTALDVKFSDATCKIDGSVKNAARITRVCVSVR